jgi:hypothetical protein
VRNCNLGAQSAASVLRGSLRPQPLPTGPRLIFRAGIAVSGRVHLAGGDFHAFKWLQVPRPVAARAARRSGFRNVFQRTLDAGLVPAMMCSARCTSLRFPKRRQAPAGRQCESRDQVERALLIIAASAMVSSTRCTSSRVLQSGSAPKITHLYLATYVLVGNTKGDASRDFLFLNPQALAFLQKGLHA